MPFTRPTGTRRRAPRLAVELDGRLAGRVTRPATVLDLSTTGCLLRCDILLGRGTFHDLEMALPDGPLHAKVRVAESMMDGTPPGRCLAGVEFIALPPSDGQRLRQFVEAERRRRRTDAAAG
jgi:hypothetical protein